MKFKCQLAVQLKIEYTSIFPSSHSFDSNKSGTLNHQVHGSSADLYEDLSGHHNVFPAAASHRQWNDLLCSLEAASNEAYPLSHLVLSTSRLMSSVSWLFVWLLCYARSFFIHYSACVYFCSKTRGFAVAPTLFPTRTSTYLTVMALILSRVSLFPKNRKIVIATIVIAAPFKFRLFSYKVRPPRACAHPYIFKCKHISCSA